MLLQESNVQTPMTFPVLEGPRTEILARPNPRHLEPKWWVYVLILELSDSVTSGRESVNSVREGRTNRTVGRGHPR